MNIIVPPTLNFNSCPRKREIVTFSGETRTWGCCRRTCDCSSCREEFAKKRYRCLMESHRHLPFNYKSVVRPPEGLTDGGKHHFFKEILNALRVWLWRNPGEEFHACWFPDRDKRGHLHFNGVVRASRKAVKHFKKICRRKFSHKQGRYSCNEMRVPYNWLAYCVKMRQQERVGVISLKGKRVIMKTGKPLLFSLKDLWLMVKIRADSGWQILL